MNIGSFLAACALVIIVDEYTELRVRRTGRRGPGRDC
jgi:hypothetical protein